MGFVNANWSRSIRWETTTVNRGAAGATNGTPDPNPTATPPARQLPDRLDGARRPERRAPARLDPVTGQLAEQELGAPASWIGEWTASPRSSPPHVGRYRKSCLHAPR